jgi:hypothetical protein
MTGRAAFQVYDVAQRSPTLAWMPSGDASVVGIVVAPFRLGE